MLGQYFLVAAVTLQYWQGITLASPASPHPTSLPRQTHATYAPIEQWDQRDTRIKNNTGQVNSLARKEGGKFPAAAKFVQRFLKRIESQEDAACGASYYVKSNSKFRLHLKNPGNCSIAFRAEAKVSFKLRCRAINVGSCENNQLYLSYRDKTRRFCGWSGSVVKERLTELLVAHREASGARDTHAVMRCTVRGQDGAGYRALGKQLCPLNCGITSSNADGAPTIYFDTQLRTTARDHLYRDSIENSTDNTRTSKNEEAKTEVTKVVGGLPTRKQEWPWMVYLRLYIRESTLFCGGTILTPDYVLTAAHCVNDVKFKRGDKIIVFANEYNLINKEETQRQKVRVESITIHPKYKEPTLRGDIALLKLKRSLVFGPGVAPVCLAPKQDYEGQPSVVIGWGVQEMKYFTKRLREGTVTVVNTDECARNYSTDSSFFSRNHVCAASRGIDSCQGDSGGPLMLQIGATWYQLGITSFGDGCAKPGFPGVYTNIPQFFNWIRNNIQDPNCT